MTLTFTYDGYRVPISKRIIDSSSLYQIGPPKNILKLVERVVASQLNDHISLNGLETVRQSAYKNLVTQLTLHCFQLRMMFIWILLKVRLLLSFSWINQQHLITLTMIHSLILLAPGSVLVV